MFDIALREWQEMCRQVSETPCRWRSKKPWHLRTCTSVGPQMAKHAKGTLRRSFTVRAFSEWGAILTHGTPATSGDQVTVAATMAQLKCLRLWEKTVKRFECIPKEAAIHSSLFENTLAVMLYFTDAKAGRGWTLVGLKYYAPYITQWNMGCQSGSFEALCDAQHTDW